MEDNAMPMCDGETSELDVWDEEADKTGNGSFGVTPPIDVSINQPYREPY